MDAFDADVLICAAAAGHPLGTRVRALFPTDADAVAGVGSVLLVELLGHLDLKVVDPVTAEVATMLASSYRLQAADAVHLATAVVAGADRFVTNNRRDFSTSIAEIHVTYPEHLPGS